MMKFDHLNLPVSNLDRSRDWYISTLGLKVEFEIAASRTVALQDGEGFAIFLQEKPNVAPNGLVRMKASQNSRVRDTLVRKYAAAMTASTAPMTSAPPS